MELRNDLFKRVKQKLSFFSASESPAGEVDFLLKMNLPPLMGRRDSAVDAFGAIMSIDFFERDSIERLELYRHMLEILKKISQDNELILSILSSPDTILRERRISLFWKLLHDVVVGMESLLSTEIRIDLEGSEATVFLSPLKKRNSAPVFSEMNNGEIRLVNRLREIFDVGNIRLSRYREYATKSFSKPNAERYQKAYKSYSEIYVITV